MSLRHEDDAQPTLQVSPGALLSDQPRPKETKKDKRKGVGLSLGRKPRDQGTEKITKKGKHVRNKSGSRTPPDSPRAERGVRGGKGQPSPNVKSHRKRYSQLGLDLSSADSEGEEEEEQTYFTNQAATEEVTADSHSQEPFFSIEKDNVSSDQPTSPVLKSTVHFPVQFGEGGTTGFPVTAFEPQPPHPRLPQPLSEPTPPSPTSPPPFFPHPTQPFQNPGPWIVPLPSAPLSDLPVCTLEVGGSLEVADLTPDLVVERDQGVPEAEWRISNELRLKCKRQFVELQPTHGRLQGDQARTFFIQSRLPNADLSAIWRLSDMDGDNALSEQEFCVAMKLVLLRRKGYSLPSTLPHSLKESIAGDDHSNTIPPALASQSVMELTPVEPNTSFSEPEANVVHQQSAPQLNISGPSDADTSNSSTLVEREEPVVANIIFFAGEEVEEESDERTEFFTEKPTHPPPQPSVRRAKSLKHFTPPPVSNHNSPPPSPFSPPAASERVPIINTEKPTPKVRRSKEKLGYHTLSATDEEGGDEGHAAEQLAIGKERGHGRSTSLDLKKMIPSSDVYSDMPAAEPPRPPPKPVADDPDLLPQVRGRSASTGSISSTGPSVPPSSIDASTDALLLPGISRPVPARKAPLLPPVPKPRRPPPPRPEVLAKQNNLLRNKAELQTTIRSLKDTNATLRALNRELEEKLFGLMEDRVQLAQEVELARQMQTSA